MPSCQYPDERKPSPMGILLYLPQNASHPLLWMALPLLTVAGGRLKHKKDMRWTPSNLMNSLIKAGTSSPRKQAASITEIREAMLKVLGERGAQAFPVVQLRVTYADDVQDLWYLRGDVMSAIADMHGELEARRALASISTLFSGLLPRGLASRPSPLEH